METDSCSETSSKLWMGDLEPFMDENYLRRVFAFLGYYVQSVKWIHNRQTGSKEQYCFVDFSDPIVAKQVLENLNNQQIPGSNGKYFKLNRPSKKIEGSYQDYSVFVGDLSKEVNGQMLQNFFQQRYPSVRHAKVVQDEHGVSKGYGFVKFLDEIERNHCFSNLNGATGLGTKSITVREAFAPKQRTDHTVTMPSTSSYQYPLQPPTHYPYFLPPQQVSTYSPFCAMKYHQQLCDSYHYPHPLQGTELYSQLEAVRWIAHSANVDNHHNE